MAAASVDTKLAKAFAEPFDEEVIKKSDDGFSNVAPENYIRVLVDNAPLQYSVEAGTPVLIGETVSVNVKVTLPNGESSSANGTFNGEDGDYQNAIKAAQSVGIKLALKFWGLGLDLYDGDVEPRDDEDEEIKPKRRASGGSRSSRSSTRSRRAAAEEEDDDEESDEKPARRGRRPAASDDDDWDGTEKVGFGAHADKKWKDVPGSYLQWLSDENDKKKSPNGKKANLEIERRGDDFDPNEGAKKGGAKRAASGKRRGGDYD